MNDDELETFTDDDGRRLDRIELRGLASHGFHGLHEGERADGQRFVADVVIHLDTRRAAAGDDLAHTVDYGVVARQVVAVLAGEPVALIETLAERVAATVLAHPAVRAVDVRVHKPQAPLPLEFDDVVVTIRRDRTKLPAAEPYDARPAPALDAALVPEATPLPDPLLAPDAVPLGASALTSDAVPARVVGPAAAAAMAFATMLPGAAVDAALAGAAGEPGAPEAVIQVPVDVSPPAPEAPTWQEPVVPAVALPVPPEPVGTGPVGAGPMGPEPVGPGPVGPEPVGPGPVGPELAGPAESIAWIPTPEPVVGPAQGAPGAGFTPPWPRRDGADEDGEVERQPVDPRAEAPLPWPSAATPDAAWPSAATPDAAWPSAATPDAAWPAAATPTPTGALPWSPPAFAPVVPVPAPPSGAGAVVVGPSDPTRPADPVASAGGGPAAAAHPDGLVGAEPGTGVEPPPVEPSTLTAPSQTPPAPSAPEEDPDAALLDRLPPTLVDVVLALGGNVGPVKDTLRWAVSRLRATPGLEVLDVAPLARTAAVGVSDQPDFLNTVVRARTLLPPRELLHRLHVIEHEAGRDRTEHWGPRTLDIDIIVYGALSVVTRELELPHPRAHERAFVLQPWAALDPDAVLPGLGGGPVAALAATAPDAEGVRWLALDWLTEPEPEPEDSRPT